ncbi:MAG TPA: hypothetical protein VF773_15950 [Verrucomicrobiae bacterium]
MTPAQTKLYWKEWSAARKAGQLSDADRPRLHLEALGYAASSKTLTNEEFDKVLGAFRAISQPFNLNAQVRQIDQPDTRLRHQIRNQFACLQLFVREPCKYVAPILRDRFHVEQLEDLRAESYTRPRVQDSEAGPAGESITDSDLEQIRNTIARCLSSHRRKAGMSEHDMCQRAEVPCRSGCAKCWNAAVARSLQQPVEELVGDPF